MQSINYIFRICLYDLYMLCLYFHLEHVEKLWIYALKLGRKAPLAAQVMNLERDIVVCDCAVTEEVLLFLCRKNLMEAELVRSKNDMMCLNNQLLEAIQRKLELSQELEAWQVGVPSVSVLCMAASLSSKWPWNRLKCCPYGSHTVLRPTSHMLHL